jgi:O-antigen/teichoic acid export membrane protein
MGSLARAARKLVLLLLLAAVALAALRANLRAGVAGSGVVTVLGLGVLAYIAWTFIRWLRRLRPKGQCRPPRPPELPTHARWLRPGQSRETRHD